MPPKEPKEELDLDAKKAQLAIKFNQAARQFSALADVLSKAVAEVPIDETTVNTLTELLNAAVTKPSRKRKLAALEVGENGLPIKKRRERKHKDPNAPKGPASAYILFQNDIRAAYKKEHPEMTNKDLLRLIGDQWKTLEDEKKNYYREQHSRAKQKHDVDLAAYNAQNPDAAADAKDSEKKITPKQASDAKEVAKGVPKTSKKPVVPKTPKVAPKSAERVESSGDEEEEEGLSEIEASEAEASDAESSGDEPVQKSKAKATSEEDTSEDESSGDEPPPPPPKKSRK